MAEIQKDLARATGEDQEALLNEKLQLTADDRLSCNG